MPKKKTNILPTVSIFTPVESQNPLFIGSGEEVFSEVMSKHNGRTLAEIKEDGYRVQIHKKNTRVEAYTRQMNRVILELFPELKKPILQMPDGIFDCELIGAGKVGHHGYASVQHRFRHKISREGIEEYLKSDIQNTMPLAIKVFDTLYFNGLSRIEEPIEARRKYTESIDEKLIIPSTQRIITDQNVLGEYFNGLVESNIEGLVCKKPGSLYVPGSRTTEWIKIKRSEPLDLAILGVYMDNKEIKQLLCGLYNKDTRSYETLTKVNATTKGMNKEIYALLKTQLQKSKPVAVILNESITEKDIPDVYVEPGKSIVVEVSAMNILYGKNWQSCGLTNGKAYSLRIATLKSIRYDKDISMITTYKDIVNRYEQQQ